MRSIGPRYRPIPRYQEALGALYPGGSEPLDALNAALAVNSNRRCLRPAEQRDIYELGRRT
jgi:hypothetical protein